MRHLHPIFSILFLVALKSTGQHPAKFIFFIFITKARWQMEGIAFLPRPKEKIPQTRLPFHEKPIAVPPKKSHF